MNVAAGPKLAAAVTNAGGLGVIGGVGYTPDMLREQIAELKSFLVDKNAPFGVDLLLPQVGGSARKTKLVLLGRCFSDYSADIYNTATITPTVNSMSSLRLLSIVERNYLFLPLVCHLNKWLRNYTKLAFSI